MTDRVDEPYQITLDSFSGPLDLLLHLIEQEEMDIHEVAIAKVTDQYLFFLHDSLAQRMDIASEFIVMAATLIAIKAKSLLPRYTPATLSDEWEPELTELDPFDSAQDLAQRLLEYRFVKQITVLLHAKEEQQNESLGRLPMPLDDYREQPRPGDSLHSIDIDTLLHAFMTALKRSSTVYNVDVVRDRETIAQRMRKIEGQLRKAPATLTALLHGTSRREIVTVFLAVLELIKMNRIVCRQQERFGEIWIELQKN